MWYCGGMLQTVEVAYVETPIGCLAVSGSEKGVREIRFVSECSSIQVSDYPNIRQTVDQLTDYFDGKRTSFNSLSLHYPATDFQRKVWDALMDVPFGDVITYGALAEKAGHKGAARAVGTAMNVNPLPIIIPCHRVLPSDRTIGQYAFGADKKM